MYIWFGIKKFRLSVFSLIKQYMKYVFYIWRLWNFAFQFSTEIAKVKRLLHARGFFFLLTFWSVARKSVIMPACSWSRDSVAVTHWVSNWLFSEPAFLVIEHNSWSCNLSQWEHVQPLYGWMHHARW